MTAVDDRVRITLPVWLASANGYPTCELTGRVLRVTQRAVFAEIVAADRDSFRCLACGGPVEDDGGYCREHQVAALSNPPWNAWLPLEHVHITDVDDPPPAVALAAGNDDELTVSVDRGVQAAAAVEDSTILLRTRYEHREIAKSVPAGRWRPNRRAWAYPATASIASKLAEAFSLIGLRTDDAFQQLLDDAASTEQAAEHKIAVELPDVPSSKTSAWLHQRQAFWFARELKAAGLFLDMGTGKSKVTVDLIVDRGHQHTLIVAPLSACRVWPREFRKHAGAEVDCVDLTRWKKIPRKVEQAEEAIRLAAARGRRCVLVINYESLWRDPFAEFAITRDWDLVVLDESHRIKGPRSKASLFASRLTRKADHRLALTGTPMPHSPLDIYAQYRFLDPGIFGTSFNHFKQRYAVWGGYGNYQVQGYTIMPELTARDGTKIPNPHYVPEIEREWNERLWSIAHQVDSDDVLDLPERHHVVRTTSLESKAEKIYRQVDDDMYAEWEQGRLTVDNALARLMRLAQAANGFLPDEDSGQLREIGDEKQKLFADVLEDLSLDEPVIVFCRFTHDLDAVRQVAERQGRAYGELSGRRRDALTDEAEMSPHVDVAGVQIQSGGVGIDLSRAAYAVYYSKDFNLGLYDQSIKRVHRPGQNRPVTYLHLQVEGTVDETVDAALAQRKNVVTAVLRDLRARHGEKLDGDPVADAPNDS